MTTKSMIYDHAAYIVRIPVSAGANTANASFPGLPVALTGSLALSATFTVVTAGTSAAGNGWVINRISGTTTTALATATLGTSAIGTVVNVPLSATAGGVALSQGDLLMAAKGTDTVAVTALVYELALQPGTNVTA
jgi:hypothetical protein